jgi:hypothetical protein
MRRGISLQAKIVEIFRNRAANRFGHYVFIVSRIVDESSKNGDATLFAS